MIACARGAYLFPWDFNSLIDLRASRWSQARAWRYRKNFTAMMEGSGKSAFVYRRTWEEEERLRAFIDACSGAGFKDPMPGSYAWPWTSRVFPPRTNATTMNRLRFPRHWVDHDRGFWRARPTTPKAWQEAVKPGDHHGDYFVYDLNSAYAWAAYQPLPDVRSPVYTREVTRRQFGVYLLRSVQWGAQVPKRLRSDRGHWVTKEELTAYDASRVVVEIGMEWENSIDLREQIDWVRESFPECICKKVLRAFWGSWGSVTPVRQFAIGRDDIRELKPLAARHYCPVWAWHVLSRVGIRCAELAGDDALHVFTDAVMIPRQVQTGTDLGDWKLAYTLRDPWVSSAGVWGEGGRCIKHAGKKGWKDGQHEAKASAIHSNDPDGTGWETRVADILSGVTGPDGRVGSFDRVCSPLSETEVACDEAVERRVHLARACRQG